MKKTLLHPAEKKRQIREEALRKRDALSPHVRYEKSTAISKLLFGLDIFHEAKKILFYASFRSEVITGDMIHAALESGKEVLLPKVDEENCALTKHPVNGLNEVSPGYRGIPEPTSGVCVRVEDIDVIVVPGVAFDTMGWRIGYGGGYYDRLLPRVKDSRLIIALAYEEQIMAPLPHEEHDIAMDMIVTDRKVIRCHG